MKRVKRSLDALPYLPETVVSLSMGHIAEKRERIVGTLKYSGL
jgi:hypothetical protein